MIVSRMTMGAVAVIALSTCASAHFTWLTVDSEGRALLFFGEGPAQRDYSLPEAVEKAKVLHRADGEKPADVAIELVDEKDLIGLRSKQPIAAHGELQSTLLYGVYHDSKLTYYAQHDCSIDDSTPAAAGSELPRLRAVVKRARGGGVDVRIFWEGKPLPDADVQLFCEEGHEEAAGKTDAKGRISFEEGPVEPGLNGLLVGHAERGQSGEIDGEPYTMANHYLTATFHYESAQKDEPVHSDKRATKSTSIAPLPEAVASFGAATADGWLYVYSGHRGTEHDHSRENLGRHFYRARLDAAGGWEELAMGPPLQGLALVADQGKLYRIGGLDARNAPGDEVDLHSTDSFASYDPETNQWTELAPLPAARSSHNAVVLDHVVYVLGGWRLAGGSPGDWQASALAFDLQDPDRGWYEAPEPPFRLRALAVGHAAGKVVALCGMNDEGELSRDVHLFDPDAGQWTAGPRFPGKPFDGFGLAAWNAGGALYAGGAEGVLYRLSDDLTRWVPAGQFAQPRFFHQLATAADGAILAVAGASHTDGHLATIERIEVDGLPVAE